MTSKDKPYPDDNTAAERRKNLTSEQLRELELAGGVEGGMAAGSGGPSTPDDRSDSGKGNGEADDAQSA